MDNKKYTLAELRELGEFLGVPGIYSKRNQNRHHLARYIYWWLHLDDQANIKEDTPAASGFDEPNGEDNRDANTRGISPAGDSSHLIKPDIADDSPKTSSKSEYKKSEVFPDNWNPAHFGEIDPQAEPTGQLLLTFYDPAKPPDPDDFPQQADYLQAWANWEQKFPELSQHFTGRVNHLVEIASINAPTKRQSSPPFPAKNTRTKQLKSYQSIN